MSRIGKKPIKIPDGVTVKFEDGIAEVAGPKGNLKTEVRPEVIVKLENNEVIVDLKRKTKNTSAFWGLTRALINNMIKGVTEGFEKKLELVGVGYRVKQENPKKLVFSIGYSHPVEFEIPEGIEAELEDNKNILIKGIDKHMVGQIAANIRKIRKPEPYKGKGIKYADEHIKTKPGKAGV